MSDNGVHRELHLPGPLAPDAPPPSKRPPIDISLANPVWIEVALGPNSGARYVLGSEADGMLDIAGSALREAFPGAEIGARVKCPLLTERHLRRGVLLRAVPGSRTHYWPLQLTAGLDRGGTLLRSLAPTVRDEACEVVLQFVFRRVGDWEHRFLGRNYDEFLTLVESSQRATLLRRRGESAYHLEVRASVVSRDPELVLPVLQQWVGSWASWQGDPWRKLRMAPDEGLPERLRDLTIGPKRIHGIRMSSHRGRLLQAMVVHSLRSQSTARPRRDVSGRELAAVLPVPWRERHAGVVYAGAPVGSPLAELLTLPGAASASLGTAGGTPVRLPSGWHHLAILGRTRSGKSTAAQNVILDILRADPSPRVVVLEPTGGLIHDLVGRIPADVAKDTVVIDPSRPTFTREGVEMAAVPLNLLQMPSRGGLEPVERERQAERLSGDLVQAIKNAWGEESIGGRADFILRAVLQGLSGLDGTTLVDVYAALSDKNAMKRLERLSSGDSLRSTLKVHLPKLDYSMTISSLDKVGKIATNPLFRKALCQRADPVQFERLLQHRLLLLNLGKGPLGTEGAGFLGAIFLTRLWSAIQERPGPKTPIYLVVDEFHNYAIPAFADMLSEGARLGLHVVPITQFLGRIPPKVRSAMVGNVDAWMMFSLGAEDTREAWQIVRGEQFGWRPEDLDSGLRPHQAALATRGSLIKVDTRGPVAGSPRAAELAAMVEETSRRYARAEDSGASPLTLSQDQVVRFLGALESDRARPRAEIGRALGWSPDRVSAAASLCLSAGNAAEDQGTGLRLRRRGRYLREAVQAARNEAEEHCGLLADAAAFLDGLGIAVRIVPQEGGYFRPDAEFERRGRTYNVEVECSTLASRPDQVLKNVAKARSAGRRCLVVVSDHEAAERFVAVAGTQATSATPWAGVGLVWRDPAGGMTPYAWGDGATWGWLTGGPDEESVGKGGVLPTVDPLPDHGTGLGRALVLAHLLLAKGRATDVTLEDFASVAEPGEWLLEDPRRLGMALSSLGVPSRRERRGGPMTRFYDLRPLADRVESETRADRDSSETKGSGVSP